MIPDRWYVLSVVLPSEGDHGLLSEGLVHLGGRAVEERDGRLVTYLSPPDDPEGFVVMATRMLEAFSGILSIAAAKLGAREVLAFEMDPYACHAAWENVQANGVEEVVRIQECRMRLDDLSRLGPLDGLVANIESGVLHPLLPGFREALAPGGWLIVSGILREECQDMQEAASRQGLSLEVEDMEGEWWSARFRRSGLPGGVGGE